MVGDESYIFILLICSKFLLEGHFIASARSPDFWYCNWLFFKTCPFPGFYLVGINIILAWTTPRTLIGMELTHAHTAIDPQQIVALGMVQTFKVPPTFSHHLKHMDDAKGSIWNRIMCCCTIMFSLAQVFQSDGTFVGKFGSCGSKPGQLEHPHYIAVSSTNRVIVSDSNNHRIQIFDVNGRVLTTFGNEGSEEGQFKFPR